ncbi:MAG: hypothetical protein WC993_08775 [Methanoculleus sp.]|nr:hypothetical protein [Methanomicrobiales archaeon]
MHPDLFTARRCFSGSNAIFQVTNTLNRSGACHGPLPQCITLQESRFVFRAQEIVSPGTGIPLQ